MSPRRLTGADLDSIDRLRPPDWAPYRATFERYFTLGCCTPFGIDEDGSLAAMATLIEFGKTGWIAQLITAPACRGRGLGTRLVDFIVAEASRRGMETLSLVATDQGYPLYRKAGFRVEGEYRFWVREAGPAPAEAQASAGLDQEPDLVAGAVEALDQDASGEDRGPYWSGRLTPGFASGRRGSPEGFYLPRVGEGLVVARTVRAGIPLLHQRLDGSNRCVVPSETEAAIPVLESRGFTQTSRARRMVLGRSLDRKPGWVWSRIGGNLG